jgi:hypothetical protein
MNPGDKVTTIGDDGHPKPVGVFTGQRSSKKGKVGWPLIRWHRGLATWERESDLRPATQKEIDAADLRKAAARDGIIAATLQKGKSNVVGQVLGLNRPEMK